MTTEVQPTNLKDTATRTAVLTALSDVINTELKTAKAELQAGLKAAKEETGTQQIGVSLPDGQYIGKVSLVQPKPAAAIVDDKAFLEWVRTVRPGEIVSRLVTEVRPAWAALVLKQITAAGITEWADPDTGVIHEVPGVQLQGRAAYTRMTLPDTGKAAIAQAWRDGRAAAVMPPAIAPAPVESGPDELAELVTALRDRIAELEQRDAWLSSLEAAGIDNWEGIGHAAELHNGGEQW